MKGFIIRLLEERGVGADSTYLSRVSMSDGHVCAGGEKCLGIYSFAFSRFLTISIACS